MDQKANVSLNFVVVGASLAGLASAYTLGRAGHHVVVIERMRREDKSTGGVGLSPSMTRILSHWGLDKKIEELFQVCNLCQYFDAQTGQLLGALNRQMMATIKGDFAGFMIAHHAALVDLLYELASNEGVQFRYSTTAEGIDEETNDLRLTTGEVIPADLIIAADGSYSIFRHYTTNEDASFSEEDIDSLAPPRFAHIMAPISMEVIRKDKDLDSICEPTTWDYWLGDGYVCHCSVSNHGQNCVVAIVLPAGPNVMPERVDWNYTSDYGAYGFDPSKLENRVSKLFGLADHFYAKIYEDRPLNTIEPISSKVVLVGEAAHAILPGSYHYPALAFEDAHTLGYLFSKIASKGQIPKFLSAYEEIRQPRLKFVQDFEIKYRTELISTNSEVRERRDVLLKRLNDYSTGISSEDEQVMMDGWGKDFAVMSYDATEKVKSWWRQYGASIVGTSRESKGTVDEPELAVAVDMEVAAA